MDFDIAYIRKLFAVSPKDSNFVIYASNMNFICKLRTIWIDWDSKCNNNLHWELDYRRREYQIYINMVTETC